ncbi:MAG: shikimate kinase [Halodesulfurarchaeum sp.]
MDGRASAPAAATILNALATGRGSAFAIDADVSAEVTLGGAGGIQGKIDGHPDGDTALIERCVAAVTDRFEGPDGGTVRTESDVPLASGLKSSSAAANATVLATLDALDEADTITREEAARIGVAAARDAGVTVTGAFDDASASMLGGITVTDNTEDKLLQRDSADWHVAAWIPPRREYSVDAAVERCEKVGSVASVVEELALTGRYATAMTVNGFAFTAALDQPTAPMLEALPDAEGVSLSGTGPSYVAIGEDEAIEGIVSRWNEREGGVLQTKTQTQGAQIE